LAGLEKQGAEIRAGDQTQEKFLADAFSGADAAYVIIPPKLDAPDVRQYYNNSTDTLVKSIKASGLKKVVFLSSLGADQDSGTGPVLGLHDAENKLRELGGVDIVFLRPGFFMENTLWNIPLIKGQGVNGNPASPDAPLLMIATKDIAEKAAELLDKPSFTGHSVVDLFGDRLNYTEVTELIGEAVGIPDLKYNQFGDADAIESLKQMGLSESVASSYVELSHGISQGKVSTTQVSPEKPTTSTRFGQFAKDIFANAFAHA
jgi:uncharacterized protein YbjT (DUF2867 family)